jgi:hypothetical protein
MSSFCCCGGAATFTSSQVFSQIKGLSFNAVSNKFNTTTFSSFGNQFNGVARVETGFAAASVSVDTTEDDGKITDLQIRPYQLTTTPVVNTFSATTKRFDPSVSFPDPPVLITISGQWEEKLTITSLTGGAPAFLSSTEEALNPASSEWYQMYNQVQYSNMPFTLNGVYQVKSPFSTVTSPFSLVFDPVPDSGYALTNVRASSSFSDGFLFTFEAAGVSYHTSTSRIFNDTVDGMQFSVDLFDNNGGALIFAQIPEPVSFGMFAYAFAVSHALRCGRHSRRSPRRLTWKRESRASGPSTTS